MNKQEIEEQLIYAPKFEFALTSVSEDPEVNNMLREKQMALLQERGADSIDSGYCIEAIGRLLQLRLTQEHTMEYALKDVRQIVSLPQEVFFAYCLILRFLWIHGKELGKVIE